MDGILVIFVILIALPYGADTSEQLQILFQAFICNGLDPSIVHNYTCSVANTLTKTNQTIFLRSQQLILQPGVKLHNYHLHLRLFRKFGTTFRPYLINIEQDLCALLGRSGDGKKYLLLKKLLNFEQSRKFGNYYEPCPFYGTRYERNVPTQDNYLAIAGVYRFDITGFTSIDGIRRNITLAKIFGEIRIE